MENDKLFELIRSEQVVLFAGAGLSQYAGFPSGTDLAKKMKAFLDPQFKKELKSCRDLGKICQCIENTKGREFVLNQLEKIFDKIKIKNTSIHNKIRLIPHFKSILTTNYDTLFEKVYGEDIQVFCNSKDLASSLGNKTELFKLHGDLNHLDRIILTSDDYLSYFSNECQSEAFWTAIKEKFTTKHILFIGYSFQDENIQVLFDKLKNELGNSMKQVFLVSPKISEFQKLQLAKKGIQQVDQEAKTFIEELITNIEKNIIKDIEQKKVSPTTGTAFLRIHKTIPIIEFGNRNPSFKSIRGSSPDIQGLINFSIMPKKENVDFFRDLIDGRHFDPVTVSGDEIKSFKASIGGITIPWLDDIKSLIIDASPTSIGSFDIVFEDGFELTRLDYKFYSSKNRFQISISFGKSSYIIKVANEVVSESGIQGVNLNATFNHDQFCYRIDEEIKIFSLLKRLVDCIPFKVYFNQDVKGHSVNPKTKQDNHYANFHLDYFEKLKKIERYFDVRFTKFDFAEITDNTLNTLNDIIAVMEGHEFRRVIGDKRVMIMPENDKFYDKEHLLPFLQKKRLEQYINQTESVNLHGIEINIGYPKIKIEAFEFVNTKQLLAGKKEPVIIQCAELWISFHKQKK